MSQPNDATAWFDHNTCDAYCDEPRFDDAPSIELLPDDLVDETIDMLEPLSTGLAPRVGFAAPLSLQPEGQTQAHDAIIMNLSLRGMACQANQNLSRGDRVWAKFHLGLADKPLTLLCEVIWHRCGDTNDTIYGLHFTSLTSDESTRICDAVRERTEGRAGAWPLPLLPKPQQAATPTPKKSTAFVSAAMGLVAGAVMTFVFSLIPSSSVEAAIVVAPSPEASFQTPAQTSLVQEAPKSSSVATKDAGAATPAITHPKPTQEKVQKQSSPVLANNTEKAQVSPAKSTILPKKKKTIVRSTMQLRPFGDANVMSLALLTDGPVHKYVTFWLNNPPRLVVDILGRHSDFVSTQYDVDHPLASRLRIGDHDGKVRFVLETSPDVDPNVLATPTGNTLLIELHR